MHKEQTLKTLSSTPSQLQKHPYTSGYFKKKKKIFLKEM